jgi:hypothetical protein
LAGIRRIAAWLPVDNAVLDNGALPLAMLDSFIDDWIAHQIAGPGAGPGSLGQGRTPPQGRAAFAVRTQTTVPT